MQHSGGSHYMKILTRIRIFSIVFFLSVLGFSSPKIETFFSPYKAPREAMIEAISKAKHTIDIAIYSFSASGLLTALKEVKESRPKLKIRMIFDDADNPDDSKGTPKTESSEKFEKMGMDVRYVHKIMHHKFMIIDGYPKGVDPDSDFSKTVLVTGSGNFSDGAHFRYNENFVILKNEPDLITQFQKEFQRMWNYSFDFPDESPQLIEEEYEDRLGFDDPDLDSIFTSDNFRKDLDFSNNGERVATREIEEAVENAKKSILVATGHFRLPLLANALIRAKEKARKAKRNLSIKVVVDGQDYVSKQGSEEDFQKYERCVQRAQDKDPSRLEACDMMGGLKMSRVLSDHGIDVRYKYYSYKWLYEKSEQMHHKYMIVDGARVLSGSFNWSRNAEWNTLENIVIFQGPSMKSVVGDFESDFYGLWELDRKRYQRHLKDISKKNRVPLHFKPMALTSSEIDRLFKALKKEIPDFLKSGKPEDSYWLKKENRGK